MSVVYITVYIYRIVTYLSFWNTISSCEETLHSGKAMNWDVTHLSCIWKISCSSKSQQWSVFVQDVRSLPCDIKQSQHSHGIGLSSWRFSQHDKQRPSSAKICSAGHTVQFHLLGPVQSMQDGSHALQMGSSLWCSRPWSNRKLCYTAWTPNCRSWFDYKKKQTQSSAEEERHKLSPAVQDSNQWDMENYRCHSHMWSLHSRTDKTEHPHLEGEKSSRNTSHSHFGEYKPHEHPQYGESLARSDSLCSVV